MQQKLQQAHWVMHLHTFGGLHRSPAKLLEVFLFDFLRVILKKDDFITHTKEK